MQNRALGVSLLSALSLAVLVLAIGGPPAVAEQHEETMDKQDVASYGRGHGLFQRYCRSCHGRTAEGDGSVAEFLKIPPTNLTRLTIDNDGEFPTERVLRSIDGREDVRVHGRDMPVWGSVFQVEEDQSEEDAQAKMNDVVAYLKGIQAKADSESD